MKRIRQPLSTHFPDSTLINSVTRLRPLFISRVTTLTKGVTVAKVTTVAAAALLQAACGGGGGGDSSGDGSSGGTASANYSILAEGTGIANAVPLHPLTRGQTYSDGWTTTRVEETFWYQDREMVRLSSGSLNDGTKSVSWVHKDSDGLWLDGSGADGMLSAPILVVPATVRDGMQWRQTVRINNSNVTITSRIEQDADDSELWTIYREQSNGSTSSIVYREGVGPWTPIFRPLNPPLVDSADEAETLTITEEREDAPIVLSVAYNLDGYGRMTGATSEFVRNPKLYENGYEVDLEEHGVHADAFNLPIFSSEPYDVISADLPQVSYISSYKTVEAPWGGGNYTEFVETDDGWRLLDLVTSMPSRLVQYDLGGSRTKPFEWYIAHPDGTMDVQKVEDGAVVRRRLGRIDMASGETLQSSWMRWYNDIEGIIVSKMPTDLEFGEARMFTAHKTGEGDLLPNIPWAAGRNRDGDVEVCWNTSGGGSEWSIDGNAVASVLPTRPGCALLVRDWSTGYPPLDSWPQPVVRGVVEGIGPFVLHVTSNADDRYLWGESISQTENVRIYTDNSTSRYRVRGGVPGGSMSWPSNCVADLIEGCWYTEKYGSDRVYLYYLTEDGTINAGLFQVYGTYTPVAMGAGGVLMQGGYGTYDKVWVKPDGSKTTIDVWPSSTLPFANTFDGEVACYHPSAFECLDLETGDVLYSLDVDAGQNGEVYMLDDNRMLLWPEYGAFTAWIVDRSDWTATQVTGDLAYAYPGGVLSNGQFWGWRADPDDRYNMDKQLVLVDTDGKAKYAELPISLEDRNTFAALRMTLSVDITVNRTHLEADDDLVYWVRSRLRPSVLSSVMRFPWSALDLQDL